MTPEALLPLGNLHSGQPDVGPDTAVSERSRVPRIHTEHTPEELSGYVPEGLEPVKVSSGKTNEASPIRVRRCSQ